MSRPEPQMDAHLSGRACNLCGGFFGNIGWRWLGLVLCVWCLKNPNVQKPWEARA